jgi:muramoyltetrapeptide carboxypeptidase LdcA involved in peptidoglycan recycling
LGVPVVTGFPFGHDSSRNAALPFGVRVRLDADACALEFLEPVAQG